MKRAASSALVCLLLSLVTAATAGASAPEPRSPRGIPAGFSYYAVFHKVWDLTTSNAIIETAAMSGDGERLILGGRYKQGNAPVVLLMKTDGTGVQTVGLPDLKKRHIAEVAINRDGSRAFFVAGAIDNAQLYSVDARGRAGLLIEIGTPAAREVVRMIRDIQPTADGARVYFRCGGHPGGSRGQRHCLSRIMHQRTSASTNCTSFRHMMHNPGYGSSTADKYPIRFSFPPEDMGRASDKVKGDGVFTTLGKATPAVGKFGEMTVRVSVRDKAGTIVVADKPLVLAGR